MRFSSNEAFVKYFIKAQVKAESNELLSNPDAYDKTNTPGMHKIAQKIVGDNVVIEIMEDEEDLGQSMGQQNNQELGEQEQQPVFSVPLVSKPLEPLAPPASLLPPPLFK